ncbi:hypothetical protein O4N82_22885 [Vibrio parahaemolyticus]|uniref:hypothetical protein n=1 Tax=Vibrio parahaemolyticus TaxID=670 RepID=UPI0022B3CDDE|nr:hypothetical protein [Vibrio parahaemolyticus]MCZ6404562.1 hypothetical protein [Vibrio parahaemolyticus]
MDSFIQLVGAFGVGGLLVKLIDIFVLQPFIAKKRDKQLAKRQKASCLFSSCKRFS